MKILKGLAFAFLGFALLASTAVAQDHERLTTSEGRIYHEVFVLAGDGDGLTFRHRDGVAKVPFQVLSPAFRMLYETVEELPTEEAAAGGQGEGPLASDPGKDVPDQDWIDFLDAGPVHLMASNRLLLRRPPLLVAVAPYRPCRLLRYGSAHRLAYPLGRELALREFLLLSGLAAPACFP